MIYWSTQSLSMWEEAQKLGYLTGNQAFIWEDFLEPYNWLVQQMKLRLNIDYDFYPVWMWDKKPDLRSRGNAVPGEKSVLLRIDVDEKEVLASDYESWHCVLNHYYLGSRDEYGEDDEIKPGVDMEATWMRVFDLELLRSDPEWYGSVTPQYTTSKIPLEKIKVVKQFIGR